MTPLTNSLIALHAFGLELFRALPPRRKPAEADSRAAILLRDGGFTRAAGCRSLSAEPHGGDLNEARS